MKQSFLKFAVLPISLFVMFPSFAATPINLAKQPLANGLLASPVMQMKETKRAVDFKKTLHIRMKQTYQGYPVWGSNAILHVPNAGNTKVSVLQLLKVKNTINGTVYQNLDQDLINTPARVFTPDQAEKAMSHVIQYYTDHLGSKPEIEQQKNELIVFIDKQNKAHWAFKTRFYHKPVKKGELPARPVFIVDATTFDVYAKWNDIRTEEEGQTAVKLKKAWAGGFGGNEKMGKLVYDGLTDNLPKLSIKRNPTKTVCFLENDDVTVRDDETRKFISFTCKKKDNKHNGVYWDADKDAANGGYSPGNDALYAGAVIKDMYKKWYDLDVLTDDDETPLKMSMFVHAYMDNAYWDPDSREMHFGDGIDYFYPLTSLGVGAHEISHGFTSQHSDLEYYGQSGGMNEAFSDMAAQAAEFYSFGHNSWQIGPEIFKMDGMAIRYMDQPSKDCNGNTPGDNCSIDDASQYPDNDWELDVHYSSGVYNHFFYLLATTEGWDTKKAFDVMVQAQFYWEDTANFNQAACGVITATNDFGYDVNAVINAFNTVKVDTSAC